MLATTNNTAGEAQRIQSTRFQALVHQKAAQVDMRASFSFVSQNQGSLDGR